MKFEYLDPDKLIGTSDFQVVESFLTLTGRTQIGWHYIVDLTWIYSQAKHWPPGLRILDAGGGAGPVQFLLAEMGMDVVNIDLVHRTVPFHYAKRYALEAKRLGSYMETDYVAHLHGLSARQPIMHRMLRPLADEAFVRQMRYLYYKNRHDRWRQSAGFSGRPVGRLTWLSGNLCNMPEISGHSFDGVVSLSALEHIPVDVLPEALKEIDRLLKPGSFRAVTTSATEKPTWFHEPSMGMCFSKEDIEKLFAAEQIGSSAPAVLLDKYRANRYLPEHLARFYKKSGNNGMPWGVWDPQYIPVGIRN